MDFDNRVMKIPSHVHMFKPLALARVARFEVLVTVMGE